MRSLRHFAGDVARAAVVFAVSAAVGDYATENKKLRGRVNELLTENAVLVAETYALAAMVDDFARENAVMRRAIAPDLDACETFEDFLYLTGDDA